MSFGYSVGDFLAVGKLAWDLYKRCATAPESFYNISLELASMHAILKDAQEVLFARPLSEDRAATLKTVGDGCEKILKDLDQIVTKFESLGTQSRRTWDRMRWHSNDIAELRSRLIAQATLLNTFMSTSQVRVEQQLDNFLQEFREGHREGSVVTNLTADSLSRDEKAMWRQIRKELKEIGISVAAFQTNKDFILEWFANAVAEGAFGELHEIHEGDNQNANDHTDDSPLVAASQRGLKVVGSENVLAVEWDIPERAPARIPRFAQWLAALSRPGKALEKAIILQRRTDVLGILAHDAKAKLLTKENLKDALLAAIKLCWPSVVKELISRGVNVNSSFPLTERSGPYGSRHRWEGTLSKAAALGNLRICKCLLAAGAFVDGKPTDFSTPLTVAIFHHHSDFAQMLIEAGADINLRASGFGTPLSVAINVENDHMCQALIKAGADLSSDGNNSSGGLLLSAAVAGNASLCSMLIDAGAYPKVREIITATLEAQKSQAEWLNSDRSSYGSAGPGRPLGDWDEVIAVLKAAGAEEEPEDVFERIVLPLYGV